MPVDFQQEFTMRDMMRRRKDIVAILAGALLSAVIITANTEAHPQAKPPGQKAEPILIALPAGYIGGTVVSAKGPEAGVWVIAETADLGTKFRKIVVTDDQGRYLVPDLPKAKYKVWVRGYGLVDSEPAQGSPGDTLALSAVLAPDPRAAAEYYPPDYWYSLLRIPAKSEFPMAVPGHGTEKVKAQAQWIYTVKSNCEGCHQMGEKATREIPTKIGKFDSSKDAWDRYMRSGQVADDEHMNILDHLGHGRGIGMFADWTDRIAEGEVPPQPPRPQGVERNVVVTVWDFSIPTGFPHDTTTTVRRMPTANAYGPIYSPDWASGALAVLDPSSNEKYMLNVPIPNEEDRKKLTLFSAKRAEYPSGYWGDETKGLGWRNDIMNPGPSMMDTKGRVWFNIPTRLTLPDYCKQGSSNPFAKNYPIPDIKDISEVRHDIAGVDYYDPKAGRFTSVDTCFGGGHTAFGFDKDETLYVTPRGLNGLGWINTRIWDETHSAEKAQGWCPAVIDYNGDGKTGPFTKPNEPPDPKLDRYIGGKTGYIISVNPMDGSVWFSVLDTPGYLARMVTGDNPPETCKTEVYEAPFDFNDPAKQDFYSPRGIDFDTSGLAWTTLSASGQLASFDRKKCKVLNGPTATGQHCPEGWTMYQIPGPKFKGTNVVADFSYNSWVDRDNTSGLGKNASIVSGTGSDSYVAYIPETKKWLILRVPYPMGFYTRSLEGRIDDPNAGWKGRGLWGANETRNPWEAEGDKFDHDYFHDKTPFVVHFQVRPDPLAK
ncbi:MAG: carboxypeptidase regulatory-like domain-containing protein [Candidatus Acidiferrales bacterium]|jgi:hypothetical protein